MAKKTKTKQIKAINWATEKIKVHKIGCMCCEKEESYEDDTYDLVELARKLYDEGWRYAFSKEYAVEGSTCGTCMDGHGEMSDLEDCLPSWIEKKK